MMTTILEIGECKKVYILYDETSYEPIYSVYKVHDKQPKGISGWTIFLSTFSRNKRFKKNIYLNGYMVGSIRGLNLDRYKIFASYREMIVYYCSQIKKNPLGVNKTVLKRLKKKYPEYLL